MSAHNTLHELADSEFALLDPGNGKALIVDRDRAVTRIVTAGAETRTLANPPRVGIQHTIAMQTDGGDCVITVASAINQAGNTTITLNDAGDTISLLGIQVGSNLRWRVIANDGAALS